MKQMRMISFLLLVSIALALVVVFDMPPPPNDASARGEPWTRNSMGTWFLSGAHDSTYAIPNQTSVWRTVSNVGSGAGDTLYLRVHDKRNNEWVEIRTDNTALGSASPTALMYYAPQIDSVNYVSTSAVIWVRFEFFH